MSVHLARRCVQPSSEAVVWPSHTLPQNRTGIRGYQVHRTLRRISRLSTLAAAGIAVVGSGAFVMSASYSSFSSNTTNQSNNWTSGSVKLDDDDNNTAMFTTAATGNVKPGSTGSNCITVTSTGTLGSVVKLYGAVTDSGLAQYVNLKIEAGAGGGFGSCSGFTASGTVFDNTLTNFTASNYGNGISGLWSPTGSGTESKVYKVTYLVSTATPDSAQGKSVSVALTWEAQNS